MKLRTVSRRRPHHGGILLTTLVIAVVVATLLAGLGTLIISYYSRVTTEAQYANAINVADGGINYELRRISQNVSNADLPPSGSAQSPLVDLGGNTFSTYCTMADGSTSWDKSTVPFCITATGTVGTISRTVRIKAKLAPGEYYAGLFAIASGSNNGNPTINGNINTDGTLDFGGTPTVTGSVVFDGATAGWGSKSSGTFGSVVYNPNAITWPTSSAVALTQFPNSGATAPGGLSYLSLHNDNATASPPIVGNSINISSSATVTLVGKAGGSNYYLTNLNTGGQSMLIFNNTLGPITVWFGPLNGSGTFSLNGGAAAVSMATDPTKAVRFYIATTAGVTLAGGSELDAGIYNVTTSGSALVQLKGNSVIDLVTVVADQFAMGGGPTITPPTGYFIPPSSGPYIFADSWTELNGM